MIVMKFGGTSVENSRAMKNVADIVSRHRSRKPLVLVSACAGVTNSLISIARGACSGESSGALDSVEQLRIRHRKIAHDLFSGELLYTVQSQVDAMLDQLRDLVRSIGILGELTGRSLDIFASFGERLSSLLLYHLMKQQGHDVVLVSATDVMITSADFTQAQPHFDEIETRANEIIGKKLEAGHIVLSQGFLGATRDGIPTTIGRGGSDYSASILGAAMGAEEIQIWTDVDGVMTCDPSAVKEARLIDQMTFREAAELAYFGAKVLHPSTILPAVKKGIPVRVLNSKHPAVEGTVILPSLPAGDRSPVKAIAFKDNITLINIESTRMLMMHGFLARVFDVFARHRKSVDVIATSEVSISLTVDDPANLTAIFDELKAFAEVESVGEKAIVCVVGENLKGSGNVLGKIFTTLDANDIRVSLVSLGASEINVTFVVDHADAPNAVRLLHGILLPAPRVRSATQVAVH